MIYIYMGKELTAGEIEKVVGGLRKLTVSDVDAIRTEHGHPMRVSIASEASTLMLMGDQRVTPDLIAGLAAMFGLHPETIADVLVAEDIYRTRIRPMLNAKTAEATGIHPESEDAVREYLTREGMPTPTNNDAARAGGYHNLARLIGA
jgi:hypothetical protein